MTPEAHLAELRTVGYTVVPDALSAVDRAAIAADVARLEAAGRARPAIGAPDGRTLQVDNLIAHAPSFAAALASAPILDLCEAVLGRGVLLSSAVAYLAGPGAAREPLHADDQFLPLPRPHLPLLVSTVWALTPYDARHGAHVLVPRSHERDRSPAPGEPADASGIELPAGSALVMNASVWHAVGANDGAERRVGLAVNWCAGFMRPAEDLLVAIPRDVARGLAPRVRKLVGYGTYKGILGLVEGASPEALLAEPTAAPR
jgi:ectoine hydroxylase-related dioxygenase (phytanoyl-CoA dioxygenase family)